MLSLTGTVLVIAQDHDLRVKLRKHLEGSTGLTVISTADPKEGLAILKKAAPPLRFILLSTELPTMDYRAFLALKTQDATAAAVPVLLLSIPLNLTELSTAINGLVPD